MDLFDNADVWRTDPAVAFAAFVTDPEFLRLSHRKKAGNPGPVRSSSAKVYSAMFNRFLRWLREQQGHKAIYDVTDEDVLAFLEQRNSDGARILEGATVRRQYLSLLERVFNHLKIEPNPARHFLFNAIRQRSTGLLGHDEPKALLANDAQCIAFMRALPAAGTDTRESTKGWKKRRDCGMQALMLGAGLKVSQVINLEIDAIGKKDLSGSVPVTVSVKASGGTVRTHQTWLRPFAVDHVLAWVDERKRLNIPGKRLFPASLAEDRGLNPASLYRQVKASFARAGIDVQREGGRTLRNSFAIRELTAGSDAELVSEFLGHRELRSLEPYQLALQRKKQKNFDR